nr:glycoside hydrolase family 43 protein [Hyphomonas pacifica]
MTRCGNRKFILATSAGMMALLAGCAEKTALPEQTEASSEAAFEYLTYKGQDAIFETPLADNQARNPILAGFYPDPSITQVGGDYYLVHSTFAYYPGIPVFHSKDLINWTQIGNVIDRPDMLDFGKLRVSRGVFAPTIEYHDGLFHVVNTCVDCGGNFVVTAADPAGPWSDPVWVPDVGGIDPSIFFDLDGKAYMINNDEPEGGSTYEGHRAIWIREIDPKTFQPVGDAVVAVNGGVRIEDKPIWIEGPHLYRLGDEYLLSMAEGGTGPQHSQVVFKSDSPLGPFTPYEGNPVLTQRDLPEDRANPVTSVGHADFAQDAAGNWWAVFLGTRPYRGNQYNTGRETFLLPVTWEGEWPRIGPKPGEEVPYVIDKPDLPEQPDAPLPLTGNFTVTQEFDGDTLPLNWMTVRVPQEHWYTMKDGKLILQDRPVGLGDFGHPSFAARRQQHMNAEASTEVSFTPASPQEEAGIAAFQNDEFYYALGVSVNPDGQRVIRLRKRAGGDMGAEGEIIAQLPALSSEDQPIRLKITARADRYDFHQAAPSGEWTVIATDQDGTILSTDTAGGFVGTMLGLYAQSDRNLAD